MPRFFSCQAYKLSLSTTKEICHLPFSFLFFLTVKYNITVTYVYVGPVYWSVREPTTIVSFMARNGFGGICPKYGFGRNPFTFFRNASPARLPNLNILFSAPIIYNTVLSSGNVVSLTFVPHGFGTPRLLSQF